ncbi:MAG: hypothetical protein K6T91_06480 [Firmicutes bacterium]|nr:hypothetical protein [Bacillota bacterium]
MNTTTTILVSKTINRKIARILKALDNKTKSLVLDILDSPIKWDLVNFYQANPFSLHTVKGLANIIGRRQGQVEKEADELARNGILKNLSDNDPIAVYSYEPKADISCTIAAIFALGAEDSNLLKQLHEILREN